MVRRLKYYQQHTCEEDVYYSVETTPFLAFVSGTASYLFSFYLNKIFGIQFVRNNNVKVEVDAGKTIGNFIVNCPFMSYVDDDMRLLYTLIEAPRTSLATDSVYSRYDKFLFVQGVDASAKARQMYDVLTAPVPQCLDLNDMQTQRRYRYEMCTHCIVEVDYYDFSCQRDSNTVIFGSSGSPVVYNKKTDRYFDHLGGYAQDMLTAVDYFFAYRKQLLDDRKSQLKQGEAKMQMADNK